MKVLVLATTFPRWPGDTEPTFVFQLSETLAKKGHQIFVLAPHALGAKLEEEQSGLQIFRFRYFWPVRLQRLCYEGGILPKLKKSILAWVNLPPFLICQAWAIGHHICNEKIDLIHVHWLLPQGVFAALWSLYFKIPIVTTIHGTDFFVFRKSVVGWMIHWVMKKSNALTVNSQKMKDLLPSPLKNKVHLLPMGVDFDLFYSGDKSHTREILKLKQQPILLAVGRLSEQKGFRYLVEALPLVLSEIPTIRLFFIGEGPEKVRLDRLVKKLNLGKAVQFLGAIPQSLLAGYYRASDLLILPSIQTRAGEEEGFGLVLAEAMASGIPTIGTPTGGIPSLIEDQKTGLLVEEKNPEALAEAILKLLKDETLRDSVIQCAMQKIKDRLGWEKIAEGFHHVYQTVNLR